MIKNRKLFVRDSETTTQFLEDNGRDSFEIYLSYFKKKIIELFFRNSELSTLRVLVRIVSIFTLIEETLF